MAKTYQFDDFARKDGPRQHANCVACEALLADALDDLLGPADQAFFDQHVTTCTTCMNAFAQAQRGAAWLSMLKDPRPEPPADLVERILAETPVLVEEEAYPYLTPVLPFVPRAAGVSRFAHLVRMAHDPRLAMTAAMAFFSIALTLNLTGVRLDQLRKASLSPTSLKRSYYEANAQALRYYDNLKVVRTLESRVDDIRESNADNRTSKPANQPATQPEDKKPETPHGSSRREPILPKSEGGLV